MQLKDRRGDAQKDIRGPKQTVTEKNLKKTTSWEVEDRYKEKKSQKSEGPFSSKKAFLVRKGLARSNTPWAE